MIDLAKMETKRLIELFAETGHMNDRNIPTVRGWLMDEIEKRNPDGFDKWLESDAEDDSLENYILA